MTHQQYQVDTHQQDDTANQPWPSATTGSLSTHPTETSAKTFSVGRVTNTLSEDKLAWRRQCNKESKRRSRARLKSPEKTADDSAKRQQRRESSSPEKRAGDNAKRREEYAKKSPEKRAQDNAKRREDYAKMSPDKKEALNDRKAELQRKKYYSPCLWEINEERRYKYLHMTADEHHRVTNQISERHR